MHVVFVEPCFPANQREFLRGLLSTGARVSAISERPAEALPAGLREGLFQFERVRSVVDERAMADAVKRMSQRVKVDRLEATVEAHVMAAAHVREQLGIHGTTSKTAWLCRDKPAMKDAVRAAGVACAASARVTSVDDAVRFASDTGYPLILKPLDAAGASGTHRVDDDEQLHRALAELRVADGREVAIEEFLTGHEGFYDTLTVCGKVVLDFACHYYPNVLEAMRTRWISPQIAVTNRIDAEGYGEVRAMGQQVIDALGIWTSATHMEWFAGTGPDGAGGLKFSEIGCRPPGVGVWDLYCAANEFDLFAAWAHAIVHESVPFAASRKYSAGMIALRPDRDGKISHYDGVEQMQRDYGQWIMDHHFPPPGTPTQSVEGGYMANAWVRLKHPDYDELRRIMNHIGETVAVHAR
ncbi:MAG: ATP-grasp domain-containing protein [Planctomycetes bacterium]|nr:ATP-grasp domain-containing protein [Planctomycetota bacterium]